MPEITSGAFWDATIYSPRSGKSLELPLKEGLDPKKYGSYSSEKFAYFFIYEGEKRKNGKHFFGFESVPVRIAAQVESSPDALLVYAKQLADDVDADVVRIARSRIYKKQVIEINGERFYITGKKEMRNGTQIAFSQKQINLIKQLEDILDLQNLKSDSSFEVSTKEVDNLFAYVINNLQNHSLRLYNQLKLQEVSKAEFDKLSISNKARLFLNLVILGNAASNFADLTLLGKGKISGKLQPTYTKILDEQGIVFIDQSVTGMFERRTRIGF